MSPFRPIAILVVVSIAVLVATPAGEARPVEGNETNPAAAVVPDAAAFAIIQEANRFIQEPFAKGRPNVYRPVPIPSTTVRANAFLIAVVAQHRMDAPGADRARMATVRDAAIALGREVEKPTTNVTEFCRLLDLLNKFPDVPPDRTASHAPVRLHDTFNHDDIVGLFGSCGRKTQRLDRQMHLLLIEKKPYTPVQAGQIELLAYKLALLTQLVKEMDELVPKSRKDGRQEWARFAEESSRQSWRLAGAARGGDPAVIRRALTTVSESCAECHAKFRD